MNFPDEGRFLKAEGETFHQKGQKVWLLNAKKQIVTVKPKGGKSFGEVLQDSIWPDMWVWVGIWNKRQRIEWRNRNADPKMLLRHKAKRPIREPFDESKISKEHNDLLEKIVARIRKKK